jgi:hypothetical protein
MHSGAAETRGERRLGGRASACDAACNAAGGLEFEVIGAGSGCV